MTTKMPPRPATCPRFDECDPRCGARLTLGHLDEVFRFCHSDYESCPVNAQGRDARASDGHGRGHAVEVAEPIDCGQGDAAPVAGRRFRCCDGPLADELDALALPAADAAQATGRVALHLPILRRVVAGFHAAASGRVA